MRRGFTIIELLISLAVGLIGLMMIIFAMNIFYSTTPKILAKVNQASDAILVNELMRRQIEMMGQSISTLKVATDGRWISFKIEVPFGQNGIYYQPYTQNATITMDGSSIVMAFKNADDPSSEPKIFIIAKNIENLFFYQPQNGTVKYTITLSKDGVTSKYTSAITSMNLR